MYVADCYYFFFCRFMILSQSWRKLLQTKSKEETVIELANERSKYAQILRSLWQWNRRLKQWTWHICRCNVCRCLWHALSESLLNKPITAAWWHLSRGTKCVKHSHLVRCYILFNLNNWVALALNISTLPYSATGHTKAR